jgi:hypothetical protein
MFAKPANDQQPCEFQIPSCIEDIHECIVKEDYWYLKNYKCKFALSENFFNSQMKKTIEENNIDIKEYIVSKNTIRYYLLINFDNHDYNVEKLCHQIKNLQIPPKFIAIMFYLQDKDFMSNVVNAFKDIIGDSIEYKIHNFVEEISKNEALFTVMETTSKKNNSEYLWILDIDSLDYSVEDESIAKINYQINAIQPICNMLKSKNSNDNFNTLFLHFENYSGITKNINQSLSVGIESIPNMVINNYD